MEKKSAYKATGFVMLMVGILFFLRDIDLNLIGNTSGWTIFIILIGAALVVSSGVNIIRPPRKMKD